MVFSCGLFKITVVHNMYSRCFLSNQGYEWNDQWKGVNHVEVGNFKGVNSEGESKKDENNKRKGTKGEENKE